MKAKEPEVKKPEVYQEEKTGKLLTTCCQAAPIFYRSGRKLCGQCAGAVIGVYGIGSHPAYESVSHADIEAKKLSGAKTRKMPTPRLKSGSKIKPCKDQLPLRALVTTEAP